MKTNKKQKVKSKVAKRRIGGKKAKNIMKKVLLVGMVMVICLPMFTGLLPQEQQVTQIDPKLAQAYLESINETSEEMPEPESEESYEVLAVPDDASITVLYEGKEETVRMIGVEKTDEEPGHNLEMLLTDNYVKLEFDEQMRDENGHLLAYVYLEDGRLLNQELLQNGFAVLKKEAVNRRHEELLLEAQDTAKELQHGAWEE